MAETTKKESIFLTVAESVRAIRIDFKEYPPQMLLFSEIIALISRNTLHLKRESGKNGAWVNRAGQRNMKWLDGHQIKEFMCQTVSDTQWNLHLLAAVCSRVFQTHAFPAADPDSGEEGVRIETNMEAFSCRQCGHCCRSLDYHHEVKEADIAHWKALGREDILKWVEVTPRRKATPALRIWVSPKTLRIANTCPFLEKDSTQNRWQCRIHDVKPGICRQYPISRKHALMTGCAGFNKGNKQVAGRALS